LEPGTSACQHGNQQTILIEKKKKTYKNYENIEGIAKVGHDAIQI
jgi:hypothetical protein